MWTDGPVLAVGVLWMLRDREEPLKNGKGSMVCVPTAEHSCHIFLCVRVHVCVRSTLPGSRMMLSLVL